MCEGLVEFRRAKNMSKHLMAYEIGVSKSYYEKIEYGDRQPSYNFISKFINRFPDADANSIFFTDEYTKRVEKKDGTRLEIS